MEQTKLRAHADMNITPMIDVLLAWGALVVLRGDRGASAPQSQAPRLARHVAWKANSSRCPYLFPCTFGRLVNDTSASMNTV